MDILNGFITNPAKKIGSILFSSQKRPSSTSENSSVKVAPTVVQHPPFGYTNLPGVSRGFLKIAALSGLSAVVMSAYGSHVFNRRQETTKDMRELYFTAQYYHLVHSVALLSIPLVKRPKITGPLWISGILLFCGTMYYHALTNDNRFRSFTPYGGFCLIAGWLSVLV